MPPHAPSRTTDDNHPNQERHGARHRPPPDRPGGLLHDNTRHTTRFTVIGNHLAQHRQLSLLAIGLAVHLQSLPKGIRVDIKTLAARFPEGATRDPDRGRAARVGGPRLPAPHPRTRARRPGSRSGPLPHLPNRSPGGRLA
ncbi:hypothetical protein SGM_4367 [Streptomyces griseoaurantiacus M045]|uniref:Uncharacterized protein n=1 Tax=Streptomyces griseoaurantiacus M045 TaxID=996637 RepID=F3NMK3_9ACTN|nr:hypothetical protein SGM_4367 [Streptomyces griseoaurantiacus M045]